MLQTAAAKVLCAAGWEGSIQKLSLENWNLETWEPLLFKTQSSLPLSWPFQIFPTSSSLIPFSFTPNTPSYLSQCLTCIAWDFRAAFGVFIFPEFSWNIGSHIVTSDSKLSTLTSYWFLKSPNYFLSCINNK